MPELPEVETIVRGLGPALAGRRVVGVEVRERRLRTPVAPDFVARLVGRRIAGVSRHGKFLLAALDDGRVWLVHLGMSGRLTIAPAPPAPRAHDHVVVVLDDGRALTYHDPRRFGCLGVLEPSQVSAATGPGIDALSPALTAETVFTLTRRRRTSIKALLMDQRRVAGLGNIYVSELLFHAGVRPGRAAGRVSRPECERIVAAMRDVLADAIRLGGSSINDYRDGFGRSGCFQTTHQVYARTGRPCPRCAAPIRERVIAGRSTFYCARCQV
ncbi:MAG: bifunctional DNA-formamidopyrimidine glycosylase/DNA-(apurinic or apyrimidinic site) lyase [Candidatus Binatia bacterium]